MVQDKKTTIELTEGSRYLIHSLGTKDESVKTEGTYRGTTFIGTSAEGICIELGEDHGALSGKKRIIPTHVILTLDIIEEKERKKDKAAEPDHYFT